MNNLKFYRNRGGLTQAQLAEATGIHQVTISYYERGLEIPHEHAREIARVLSDANGSLPFGPEDLALPYGG